MSWVVTEEGRSVVRDASGLRRSRRPRRWGALVSFLAAALVPSVAGAQPLAWRLEASLEPPVRIGDTFGATLAIDPGGTFALIGDPEALTSAVE